MKEVDPKVLEQLEQKDNLNIEKFVKFGIIEREVEPIPGWKITLHTLTQEEREKMSKLIPDDATSTAFARAEVLKRPTLVYAITKINDEIFETEEQKKMLFEKLKEMPGTSIDLLYVEYQKLYVEQFEMLTNGIKKK